MGNVLSVLVEYIHYLWPLRIIQMYEQGVRISFGTKVELLHPGWYLHFPFFQVIEGRASNYQMIDCPLQRIETLDGQTVSLSINVGYDVFDASLMAKLVHDFDHTLERLARVHLFHVITKSQYADLLGGTKELEREARKTLNQQTKEWGVRIVRVGFTDLARAKALSIMGEVPVKAY